MRAPGSMHSVCLTSGCPCDASRPAEMRKRTR
ncbi:hypothetical protein RB2654_14520 [Rhodobacterales bacterium HTCC2654]|uniref:Uncharacterized protein n=1 Tax=Maritimibacter alkaliphilus HTCC2654 TaxID=314271 RepID=A3VGV3_9RHOB|nr:hypothetical protein RB2654_14520 [Rhodobacterales bacterium HTCC2654] [Maritimibacter alkaliphilus HTCC2654]